MTTSPARAAVQEGLLDAAEQMLIDVGYAGITTRKLAEAAGVNQGLVHYYFGDMANLLVHVVERFTDRLLVRQRQMYAGDAPFIEKWREAMRYLDEDSESGYHKVWLEMQAMAWNNLAVRERLQHVHRQWLAVVTPAFRIGLAELGIDQRRFPLTAVVSLVVTFNQGIMLERLIGVDSGHRAMLRMVDRTLEAAWKAQSDDKGARA
jgi:AcrR family transcriptional regulator